MADHGSGPDLLHIGGVLTYEGTSEIHMLAVRQALTGVSGNR